MSKCFLAKPQFSETAVTFHLSGGRGRSQKCSLVCVSGVCVNMCVCECAFVNVWLCGWVYVYVSVCVWLCVWEFMYVSVCTVCEYIGMCALSMRILECDCVSVCVCVLYMCECVCVFSWECVMGDNTAQRLSGRVWESNWLRLLCSLTVSAAWYSQIPHL